MVLGCIYLIYSYLYGDLQPVNYNFISVIKINRALECTRELVIILPNLL